MRIKKKFPSTGGASSYHRERNPPMKIAAAGILVCSGLTTACVNSSTLQTAKALDPGHQRILVGAGFYSSPSINADASSQASTNGTPALPHMELGYRRG